MKISENCSKWSKIKYAQALIDEKISDESLLHLCTNVLDNLCLSNKFMDGRSCQYLPHTEEYKVPIVYSQVFDKCYESSMYSPLQFIIQIIAFCRCENINKLNGIVARGLRTYASLLREKAFSYVLNNELKIQGLKFEITSNPSMDVNNHTDVLLKIDSTYYRIWLFQQSESGKDNCRKKILGNRGKLPIGIHVLCPLISKTRNTLRSSKKSHDEFIYILNEWFFYSQPYISQVIKILINKETLYEYQFFKNELTKNINILDDIQIFVVREAL